MSEVEEVGGTSRRNSNGKRFVRRARRWAELQQRRQGKKVLEETTSLPKEQKWRVPDPPHVYDYVEMATMGSGVVVIDDDHNYSLVTAEESLQKAHLGPRRSFPCTVLHPRRHYGVPPPNYYNNRTSSSDIPLYYTEALNEYGNPTYISVYRTSPQITVYNNNNNRRAVSTSDDTLTLITNNLSNTNISDQYSSSPTSSSEEELFGSLGRQTATSFFKGGLGAKLFISKPLYIPPDFIVNTAPPPERSWVMIRHADPERPIATFTVLCYNVLCDKYATVNQYSYCPSWALNWEYRKTLILKEIRTYEADIITLQEVETEQFRSLFQPELKNMGYFGIFTPKSRAKTMHEEERKYVDGCAIFWKTDKFDLDHHHVIEFTSLAMKKASNSENMLNRVMPKDNIALCAVLKIKDNVYANIPGRVNNIPVNDNVVGNPLVVCTAHIHWDPEFCDVKLVQTMMLAHEVTRLLDDVSQKFQIQTKQCPVLICGDLNSLPDSGVFEYLSRGQISRRHMDLKLFREDPCLEKFTNSTDPNLITHPLRLDSAVDNGAIPFTNYTLDFKGMIDYIFSTPQSLARLGVLGPFDKNWIHSNKILGFPHPHVPSDHIPIMAQYAIIPTSHQRAPPPPQTSNYSGVIGGGLPSHHSFLR